MLPSHQSQEQNNYITNLIGAEVAWCFQEWGAWVRLKAVSLSPHSPPPSIIPSIIRGRHTARLYTRWQTRTATILFGAVGQRPHNADLYWPTLEALSEPSASASHSDNTRSVRTSKCACVWWGEHGAAPAMRPYAPGSWGGETVHVYLG